jgi:hypothetical protein
MYDSFTGCTLFIPFWVILMSRFLKGNLQKNRSKKNDHEVLIEILIVDEREKLFLDKKRVL